MKNYINTAIVVFVSLLAFTLASCDNNSTSPADPISPDSYPTATFTTNFQGNTVAEGDTIMYQVTTDKPLESPVTFELSVSGDSTVTDSDYAYTAVEFPAYADTTISIPLVFSMDNVPENSENLTFTIRDQDIGTQYTLNPDTEYPSMDLTLENYNDPNGLTVAFGWENPEDDMDVFINYDGGSGLESYDVAASSDNPEIALLENETPGDFYFSIDPYSYTESTISYKFSIGYPDQSVEIIEGTFNADDPSDSIIRDPFAAYDIPESLLRLLEVNVSESGKYSVQHVN